ncbi:hypothetical protein [Planobispora rosea]|nr:hypothetical protein [Planobispora rosea]
MTPSSWASERILADAIPARSATATAQHLLPAELDARPGEETG